MDSLHGYLTALALGPRLVLQEEWQPRVWGPEASDVPQFKDAKQAARIGELLARTMQEIVMTLEVAPKDFEPLFCEHVWKGRTVIDGEAWAWGFWEGMHLYPDDWKDIWESPIAPLLRPIYLLGAEEIEEDELELVDDPGKCHQLALEIEAAIVPIRDFWLARRAGE